MNDRKQISNEVTIVGGGLAGVEAAWQLAQRGVHVALYEMRPLCRTPAHNTEWLGELVCSNSLGADQPTSSGGILKEELRRLGSLVLATAEKRPGSRRQGSCCG
jgi:NAD(FAD)-utilizing enzyme possibly involved in translation